LKRPLLGFVGFFWIREKCAPFVDFRMLLLQPTKSPVKMVLIKKKCKEAEKTMHRASAAPEMGMRA
jgi:hypothetical protein